MIVRILTEDPPTQKSSLFLTTEPDTTGHEQAFLESLIKQVYDFMGKKSGVKIYPPGTKDGNKTTPYNEDESK